MVKSYISGLYISSSSKFINAVQWVGYRIFYTYTNSEDKQNKLLPSLLPNQLIISLTCQENTSRQEIAPLNLPLISIEPKKKPHALQYKTQIE